MSKFSVLIFTAPPPGMGQESSGPFVKIDGREALLRSVELFLNRDNVAQIQLVFTADALANAKQKYGAHLSFSGVKVLSGGPKMIDQLAAGATNIADDATHVIVHDAARPAVSYVDLEAVMSAAEKSEAVALTAPLPSSVFEIDEGGAPMAIHSPSRYLQFLTPLAFSKAKFLAFAKAKTELHASEYTLVPGSTLNRRVGSAGDAGLIKTLIGMLPKPKSKAPLTPFDEAQW